MKLKPIKNKKEYRECLMWVDIQFNRKVKKNSSDGEKLQIVLLLIKQYEDINFPIPTPDPLEAIKLKMRELGIRNQHFVGKAGSKGYISAVLNGKKPLTLEIAKLFHKELGVPAEILLG